jgi:septal ring-binding cell division protein DamX
MTAVENVELPMVLAGELSAGERRARAKRLLGGLLVGTLAAAKRQAHLPELASASVAAEASRVASQAEDVASAASAAASVVVLPKAEPKPAAKPNANSDEAWVNQLPANGYVVQLAAMDTQDDMLSFQRSNAVYAKTRIMRARQKDSGKRYYILVAGPFENKAQADAFMQSSPLVAKGWLRSTKSMQTQFNKS